jgi:hypothetical protein
MDRGAEPVNWGRGHTMSTSSNAGSVFSDAGSDASAMGGASGMGGGRGSSSASLDGVAGGGRQHRSSTEGSSGGAGGLFKRLTSGRRRSSTKTKEDRRGGSNSSNDGGGGGASDGDRRDRGDSSRPDSLRTSSLSLILFRSSRLSVFLRPPLGVHQMSVVRLSYRPLIDSTGSRCGQIIIRANLPPPHLSNPRSLSPTLSPLSCEMMNACKYVSTHEHTYEHVMNTRMNTRMDGCRSDPGEEGVIQEHTHTTTNRIERET